MRSLESQGPCQLSTWGTHLWASEPVGLGGGLVLTEGFPCVPRLGGHEVKPWSHHTPPLALLRVTVEHTHPGAPVSCQGSSGCSGFPGPLRKGAAPRVSQAESYLSPEKGHLGTRCDEFISLLGPKEVWVPLTG